jgi:ribosomal protein S18 acetylase RimI-like enzyme
MTPENRISVREATLNDLNPLAKLFDSYRIFYRKPSDVDAAKEFLLQRITRKESVIFIAEEREVVALAQLYPLFSSTRMKRLWLLNDLFVHPDFRRKGIAKQLISTCFQLAKETKACGVMLETERDNIISNVLYPKMGFQLIESNFYFYENRV